MFEKIKEYYNRGLWPLEWVKAAVGRKITPQQYREITGEAFEEA